MMKDPVCGMQVNEKDSINYEYGALNYYFCSMNCRIKFIDHPENYAHGGKSKKHVISLDSVWKTYLPESETPVHALKNVSLDIEKGDFIAIKGPSGSGKSTMMALVGCLDKPSKGKIFLDGHDICKLSESELAQIRGKKIGFVFKQFNLMPTMTAIKNVMLPMVFQGVEYEKRKRKADELLALVGLSHRKTHLPSEMSGGEKQRVAIARSLVNNPELILADEPTGNLDSSNGHQILKILKDLHHQHNATLVIVTHDESIANTANRIVTLKDGQILSHK